MRTPSEQVEAVRTRLLRGDPQYRELASRTRLSDGVLVPLLLHFTAAPEGPFIRILTLWSRWQQDAALSNGGYYTFTEYVRRQEQ